MASVPAVAPEVRAEADKRPTGQRSRERFALVARMRQPPPDGPAIKTVQSKHAPVGVKPQAGGGRGPNVEADGGIHAQAQRMNLQVDPQVRRFTAAVLHELRTPIAALSVEVEVALRRERPAAAYRDALARIAGLVEDLLAQTADFATFADPGEPHVLQSQSALLDRCVNIEGRYDADFLAIPLGGPGSQRVVGDESLLRRAVALLADHALRNRPEGSTVIMRAVPPSEQDWSEDWLGFLVEAFPGLPSRAWAPLAGSSPEGAAVEPSAALRLMTAARIIHGCGGSLDVWCTAGGAAARVRLRAALP